ncbi:Phosphotyrosyl phosphate activator protein-domain-containing protein [Hyaloraphidium curvatum]|nr:Phosphotyrosyl phosphate activator protein-domain-containing protein [Hyaloraphidium curvatum]
MGSRFVREQLGAPRDGFARPAAPAKPPPSAYAPDRRLGAAGSLDTPYRRRAGRPLVKAEDCRPLKREIVDASARDGDEAAMRAWLRSEGFARLMDYAQDLNEAVQGVRVPGEEGGTNLKSLLAMLARIDALTDAVQPSESRSKARFGDPAFRQWHAQLEALLPEHPGPAGSPDLLRDMLPPELHPAVPELRGYLLDAFGSAQRLDYGTGHELSFLAFLLTLSLLRFLAPEDDRAAVLYVLESYLNVCRRFQQRYFLEPAGSHGVWGLDDHQFLPYYFGSSQLIGSRGLPPRSIPNPDLAAKHRASYLLFSSLAHLHSAKRGPFHEHSPLLYDISGLPGWERVNAGLLRMWGGEVLGKRVVVQHLGMGAAVPWGQMEGVGGGDAVGGEGGGGSASG